MQVQGDAQRAADLNLDYKAQGAFMRPHAR